jgi:hypothetical protein
LGRKKGRLWLFRKKGLAFALRRSFWLQGFGALELGAVTPRSIVLLAVAQKALAGG